MVSKEIPVIDLFAGPGGLGEGFAAVNDRRSNMFKIVLSIEKDYSAFRTLRLRSLFRKIPFKEFRLNYINFAKSERTEEDELELFSKYSEQWDEINSEVLCEELGSTNFSDSLLDNHIKARLSGVKKWVLIGGPPCQAYSVVGRSRMSKIRKNNIEKFEKDERHYLYQHYLRIIGEHKPPVFVMENVKGLLSSRVKGQRIINQIINDLKQPSPYKPLRYNLYSFVVKKKKDLFDVFEFNANDFIIKSERYGIPQSRHRLIILGIRSDIQIEPQILQEANSFVTLKDVISDLPKIRSEVSQRYKNDKQWIDCIAEIREIVKNGEVPPELKTHVFFHLYELNKNLKPGCKWIKYARGKPKNLVSKWYRKDDIGGICNHEAKSHMPTDLQRYYFASCYADLRSIYKIDKSFKLEDFPVELLPKHNNIDNREIRKTVFSDRFRVQVWNAPAKTITSHIAKDGHYFIHPDPSQCRSLSVREAARIQTFPDNYIFLGSKTSQYQQVGNAVPPLLAIQLAKIVYEVFEKLD